MRVTGKKFIYLQEKRRLPNGMVTNLEMIEHPGAALIVPFKSPGEVIFLRQYRPAIRKYLFELPAGTRDNKEAPLTCARRELVEETGFAARRWEKLGKIYLAPGYSTEEIYIYKALDLYPALAEADHDEIIKTETLNRRRVQALFHQGLVVDAKTICALALCQWL
jgi:ADP-ribose pyrophosphatase